MDLQKKSPADSFNMNVTDINIEHYLRQAQDAD
jgi:hypothetical protein